MTEERLLLLCGFYLGPLALGTLSLAWRPTRKPRALQAILWLAIGVAGVGIWGLGGHPNRKAEWTSSCLAMGGGIAAWASLSVLFLIAVGRPKPPGPADGETP